ncbi:MAG: alpha/beta hydrolase-fold protein [Verrucomicrobiota bacterium]
MRISLLFPLLLGLLAFPPEASAQQKGQKKRPEFSWVSPLSEKQAANLIEGVEHRTFESPSMGIDVGYYVYLPKAYAESEDEAYPVVLHLHGGRPGSEAKSVRLASFVDAAIKSGDIQPTIYVFPNGGPMSWYNYPNLENGRGEDVLVKELIPHLKETLRTREFAIEGFSQGGRGTTRVMLRYPELFVSAAPGGSGYSSEKRVQENDGMESENVIFAKGDNTWDLAAEYAKRDDKDKLPIFLWVGTKGFNFENNLEYSAYLDSLEIPHGIMKVEGIDHSAFRIYEKQGLELMKFHQSHFAAP